MKKMIMLLMFVLGTNVGGFAQTEKQSKIESVLTEVSKEVKEQPKGTTYGVIQSTPEKYVVNTPVGKYDVKKTNGGYSFMGMFAKIVSKKGNTYIVDSSLGKFKIDTKKCSIIKL